MSDHELGLYEKYHVERTDGSSYVGGKHHLCEYFVLDWKHDPFAITAALAYAIACEATHPELAADLRKLAAKALPTPPTPPREAGKSTPSPKRAPSPVKT